ncbi:rhomboid family intramembrane serine protease [Syntrophomonas palmitatica]|uniref:rhomboid family intramembrane serine protease n=1 Tax=Syntrophomonas palmitatica TaxID=402877 RepID=UPI0006D133A7|nr:rhomboid family intramembrane serine protease [Syntrophomonas palmitatica]
MIPLRDSTPSRHFPVITVLLILINLYIFYQEVMLGPALDSALSVFGLVPARIEKYPYDIFSYLPFLSSMFLHGSWMHVIGNMWTLWLFGDNVEDQMGKGRFLLFYLICGVIAALAHYLVNPGSNVPVVGASGAVAGIMGAYFIMFRQARVLTFIPPFFLITIPAWVFLGFWALSQLYSGTAGLLTDGGGQIAFWAHVGGFAGGMVLFKLFLRDDKESYQL